MAPFVWIIDPNAYETAPRRVESQAAQTIETLRPADRIEDLEAALQLLRTALAERRGLDAASDSLRLALTDMCRRTETAAARSPRSSSKPHRRSSLPDLPG